VHYNRSERGGGKGKRESLMEAGEMERLRFCIYIITTSVGSDEVYWL
jgi:hypothetical protein